MNNKTILIQFIKFLRKKNIYEDYIKGLKKGATYRVRCSRINEPDELKWLVNTIKFCPQSLIVDAFSWPCSDSKDWISIDEKWKEVLQYKEYER